MRWGLDFHLHTHHSPCGGSGVTVQGVAERAAQVGLEAIGITDHLNKPEELARFSSIGREIETLPRTSVQVFFGCEVNPLNREGDFPCDAEALAGMGFEYVIAGVHSIYDTGDSREVMAVHQALLCLVAQQPWVDVLVHPWWFRRKEFERNGVPWPEDLRGIPEEYALQLAQVAKQHGTAVEVNAMAIFENRDYGQRFKESYVDYLKLLNEEGVVFAIGSDAHHLEAVGRSRVCEDVLNSLGVEEERIWRPPGFQTASAPGRMC